jgi:hypothetical protein
MFIVRDSPGDGTPLGVRCVLRNRRTFRYIDGHEHGIPKGVRGFRAVAPINIPLLRSEACFQAQSTNPQVHNYYTTTLAGFVTFVRVPNAQVSKQEW